MLRALSSIKAWLRSSARNTPRRKRRILFVYRYCGLGGVETATIAKASALRSAGVEASVFFSKFYGDAAAGFVDTPYVRVGLPRKEKLIKLIRTNFDALAVIDYPAFLELLFRNEVEIPILFETHSSIPASLERFYQHLGDPRIRAVVVPSSYNRELVLDRVHSSCEVVIVPNPIDMRLFSPGRVTAEETVLSDMLADEKIVLWVGRLEDEKNPNELLAIASHVLDRMTGVRFVVLGDQPGAYEERKSRLIDKIATSKRKAFTFLRALPYDCMPDLYRRVRQSGGVLLSTSLHESLPMIFIEAMACGCPVIASDVGGVRDILTDRSTGRLYSVGDTCQAVAILQELLQPANARDVQRMTRRARRVVLARHSPRSVARQYEHLLDRLVGTV